MRTSSSPVPIVYECPLSFLKIWLAILFEGLADEDFWVLEFIFVDAAGAEKEIANLQGFLEDIIRSFLQINVKDKLCIES